MSIHIALHHRTEYRYDRLVTLGPQVVRLRPAPHCRSEIISYSLRVQPSKHFVHWQQDPQSNYLARLVFPEPTRELVVEVDLVAKMAVYNPFDFFLEPAAEHAPFSYDPTLEHELAPFQLQCPATPRLSAYLADLRRDVLGVGAAGSGHSGAGREPMRTIDFLVGVNRRLWDDISYIIRLEPGVQAPEETLEKGRGSCRDSAWLLCQVLRHLGLASRFVSGYLIQLAPDVKSLDGPSGTDRDFTDLHAWCEVYLPGAGWIGLDPTSGLLAGEGHIPLAVAPDPTSAAPVTGAVGACECEFKVEMGVTRILETPRVTKPYSEEQWSQINAVGKAVDNELRRLDCRLTMGGEPTFVSIDDMEGAEWNTAALGPGKLAIGDDLIKRLKRRLAPGALIHHGQGKWYPGESLPRWAFSCYWRKDGEPIWQNDALCAEISTNYGHDAKRAEEFVYTLAERLGCGGQWILPAFEDTWYYLWKERRLPVNVDPLASRLKNAEERTRLAKVFEQGLEKVVGYVLPLTRHESTQRWESGPWFLRSERCYLLPGDSPMGYRLPLDSLPWRHEEDALDDAPPDPMESRPALLPRDHFLRESNMPGTQAPQAATILQRPPAGSPGTASLSSAPSPAARLAAGAAHWLGRTALCVEARQGRLHIFMTPVRTLEEYLDCVVAVEQTAAQLETPVVIEGYQPPFDPRLHVLQVTPDPGVIEVNVPPTDSWEQMVRQTEAVYEDARLSRLRTEKFMLDGRHTGTGGGNHIVLGGPTPADSPMLRRPDLLRSLVSYWQNHPSLSFLFSGLFIGPTSQSPRVDEARNDSLDELELAFSKMPKGDVLQPWLVDRLLRHLLVDITGNTHRAEFCIDKLYPPDQSQRRLGLLEMRAFEMPPHARMSLAQQLLLRTLVCRFWKEPCEQSLIRWGTDIHDRWMLPHFIWSDFRDVIHDLQERGFELELEWFAPHWEFRFPAHGAIEVQNVALEVRHALEPWHVLGEDSGPGGTVRYVDSSLERVQVKVRGIVAGRHVVTVGGFALPFHPTGTNGEAVAGVRYRAWQPPNCLHPTIGVHAPLVFDIVDTWNGRSIGGCTYHVAHPGGLSYTTFPINAYEAESRRLSRFFPFGHTPGPMQPRVLELDPKFPFTLDLRRIG